MVEKDFGYCLKGGGEESSGQVGAHGGKERNKVEQDLF